MKLLTTSQMKKIKCGVIDLMGCTDEGGCCIRYTGDDGRSRIKCGSINWYFSEL